MLLYLGEERDSEPLGGPGVVPISVVSHQPHIPVAVSTPCRELIHQEVQVRGMDGSGGMGQLSGGCVPGLCQSSCCHWRIKLVLGPR